MEHHTSIRYHIPFIFVILLVIVAPVQGKYVAPANHAVHVNPVAPAQGKNVALAIEQSVAPAQEQCLKPAIQAAPVQCTILL